MRRFPLRTLLLMTLALVVFGRLYFATHSGKALEPRGPSGSGPGMQVDVEPLPTTRPPARPPACNGLEQALDGVVRSPADGPALAEAQRLLEGCAQPPVRASELGTALDVRAPLAAGDSAARGLLKTLCQRCPAEANPCAGSLTRSLQESSLGQPRDAAEALWNLENAGPGTAAACSVLVRTALVPAATTGAKLEESLRPLLDALAPKCVQAGQVPVAVLSAAVVQQGARAGVLAGLTTAKAAASSSMAPSQITGAEAGSHAFDGKEKSGVDLGNGKIPRWEADGALRAQYEPPLKQLASLRIRAQGAGTVRAIVRLPPGVGLEDPERGTFFVNPTVCQFKGTRQWETCELKVPLLDVEAISVFPALPRITLHEVEVQGSR